MKTPAENLRDLWERLEPDAVLFRRPPDLPRRCASLDCNHLETEHSPALGCDRCPCAVFTIEGPATLLKGPAPGA